MTGDYQQQLIDWALTYKAYERFATIPDRIEACLAPVMQRMGTQPPGTGMGRRGLAKGPGRSTAPGRTTSMTGSRCWLPTHKVGAIADAILQPSVGQEGRYSATGGQNDLNRYYRDFALGSKFDRFGLWAPARVDGKHRFAVVHEPDGYTNHVGLPGEISRLQFEHPGKNIFVGGWADHRPEYLGLDYWPLGLITPDDFHIGFRHRNGLLNPESRQALGYAKGSFEVREHWPRRQNTHQ